MEPGISFPENWTPPRELARALPREACMTGGGTFVAIVATAFLVAAIPLFLLVRNQGERQIARAELLRTEGREATGEITRLWKRTGKSSTPMVTYAFTTGGRRFVGESSVPRKLRDGLRQPGFLPVRFLPADPNTNHPLAWDEPLTPAWLKFVFPALLGALGITFVVTLRRQAVLAAEGLPAAGSVTKCYRIKGGWAARYRFRTKEGAIVKGSDRVGRRAETGATVCILYLPQNPRQNQVYPMRLYRVAL